MHYSWQDLKKAFFLAPIPLLFITSFSLIVQNHEYRLSSLIAIFVAHLIIYLIFCIVCSPFGLLLSWWLNKYRLINLVTIFMSVILLITPFIMFLVWMYTGQELKSWWEYWGGGMLLFTCCTALSYFLILRWLHRKRIGVQPLKQEKLHDANNK